MRIVTTVAVAIILASITWCVIDYPRIVYGAVVALIGMLAIVCVELDLFNDEDQTKWGA
jgi:hypothetical protein